MKYLLIIFIIPLLYVFSSFKWITEAENNSFAVVQLFTSQGCSSCPSADKLLGKVKNNFTDKNVFVMSYHVDYWDRLGWKDPFSNKNYTLLQAAYGFVFNSRTNYTPQAVINGKVHFVGSEEKKMFRYLNKYLALKAPNSLLLKVIKNKQGKIYFEYNVDGVLKNKKIKVALVIDKRETPIGNGENGGKKLINRNIVVKEIEIPLNSKKGKGKIEIPDLVLKDDNIRIIGFIQQKDYKITAATQTKFIAH
jgi:hypothetical protein